MFLNKRLVILITLLLLQPHVPLWILIGAHKVLVTVEDAALNMKSKLIYVSRQVKFAALRGCLKKTSLEDVPVTKEVYIPVQRGMGI